MENKSFITHLAGLRGVAILLVILFHIFGQGVWEKGYLGVDIFLVITGYLIFRARLAEHGMIDLRGFALYLLRRIQRIVPPMLVIIFLSVLVGMALLWWKDEQFLGTVGYAACLAKANILLWHAFADYFAPDSAYIPILHLWYLSVILQIYLLYAVGNQILQRLPRKCVIVILLFLGVASLIYNYNMPITEALASLGVPSGNWGVSVSYYQTLPRLWEVLAGDLVCILPNFKRVSSSYIAVLTGIACMSISAFFPIFPGLNVWKEFPCTLVMVVGTVLLLRYTPQCQIVDKILSHRYLVWLGGISFSLYLVHLPIVVYLRVWTLGQPGLWVELLMILLSILFGYLFKQCMERKYFPLWAIVCLWATTFVLCRACRRSCGFRDYLPASSWEIPTYTAWKMCEDESLAQGMSIEQFPQSRSIYVALNQLGRMPSSIKMPLMVMGSEKKPVTCVLMGDSHAASLFAGMDVALKDEGISGVYLISYIYPFHGWEEDKKPNYKSMPEREKALMRWLRSQRTITHVMIAQRWLHRFDASDSSTLRQYECDLRKFLQELRDAGKKVVVIAPTPEFPNQTPLLHFDKIFLLRHISHARVEEVASVCSAESYLRMNDVALPILYKMRDEGLCVLIEPLSTLHQGETFKTVQDGKLLMIDGNHMSPGLSIPLVRKLRPALRNALR